mgnify:CR=1 FL=1
MAKWIKRDALLEARELAICAYENAGVFNADAIRKYLKPLLDAVMDTPAADVAEVVHGRWVDNGIPDSILNGCSVCGFTCGSSSFFYCPICGAKMDELDESEN